MSETVEKVWWNSFTEKVVLGCITGDQLGFETVAFAAFAGHAGLWLRRCFWDCDCEGRAGERSKANKLTEEHDGSVEAFRLGG